MLGRAPVTKQLMYSITAALQNMNQAQRTEWRKAWEFHQDPEGSGQKQALWNILYTCLSFPYPESKPRATAPLIPEMEVVAYH